MNEKSKEIGKNGSDLNVYLSIRLTHIKEREQEIICQYARP
jgi:hypothetical protein